MSNASPFAALTLLDPAGAEIQLAELGAAQPTLWVFLRHFG